MPLNTSGAISLGGTTAGQSIALELGVSATGQISLNCSNVRTLAGVASGAIIMPTNFYGKSLGPTLGLFYGGPNAAARSDRITRINGCGALVGSETFSGLGVISNVGGAGSIGSNAMFYGGFTSSSTTPATAVRINASGTVAGSTTVGTGRQWTSGAKVGNNAVFYGGMTSTSGNLNIVTRINACGALVGSETNVGTARGQMGGAPVGPNGMYYGGNASTWQLVTRINACGALVGTETNATICCVGRTNIAGAPVGGNGMFYAGFRPFGTNRNEVIRINVCGVKLAANPTVGTARQGLGGAIVGVNGLFFGGFGASETNLVTRINACAALVGSQTNAGTARSPNSGGYL